MALPAPLQALFDEVQTFNNGPYSAQGNPGGLARGGNQNPVANYLRSLKASASFAKGAFELVETLAGNAGGFAAAAAQSASDAAEDAANTALDRIETARNVGLAAAEVVKAADEVVKASEQAQKLVGTSTTNVTPGLGARNFATQPGKYFAVGTFLTIASTAAPTTRWVTGQVTAYNNSTGALTVNVEAIGSNTSAASSWNIYLGGPRGPQGVQGTPGIATMPYLARSSNTQLGAADSASLVDATGSFTQTFAAPGTLGANWYCFYKNAGTGNITIPASDGVTNWIMYPGEMRLFQCDGTTLRSEVLNAFFVTFIASGNFIKPPGYVAFEGILRSGGASGSVATSGVALGGGGGGAYPVNVRAADIPSSSPFTIGAGGVGVTSGNGGIGGSSSFAGISVIQNSRLEGAAINGLTSQRPYGFEGGQAGDNPSDGLWGGGSSRGSTSFVSTDRSGNSVHGGAAGASARSGVRTLPGSSAFAGNGGAAAENANASPGAIPSGGGGAVFGSGTSGAGGRGQLDLWGVA